MAGQTGPCPECGQQVVKEWDPFEKRMRYIHRGEPCRPKRAMLSRKQASRGEDRARKLLATEMERVVSELKAGEISWNDHMNGRYDLIDAVAEMTHLDEEAVSAILVQLEDEVWEVARREGWSGRLGPRGAIE